MPRHLLNVILMLIGVAILPVACRDPEAVRIRGDLADAFLSLFSSLPVSHHLLAAEITVDGQTRRFTDLAELGALQRSFREWDVQSYNNQAVKDHGWKYHSVGAVKLISKEGTVSFPMYRANDCDSLLIIRTYAVGSKGGALFYLLIPSSAQDRFDGLFKKKTSGGCRRRE